MLLRRIITFVVLLLTQPVYGVSVYDGFDILIVVWGSVAGIATLTIFVIIIYIHVKSNTDIIASIQRMVRNEENQETYETPETRRDSHIYNQDQDNQSDNNQYLEVRSSTTSDITNDNIQSRSSTLPTKGDNQNQLLYTGNIPNRVSGKQVDIPGEADHNRDQNRETVYEITDLDNSS